MLIDSHCHLDFPQLIEEEGAVVARARAAGVERMVTISTRLSTFDQVLSLANRHDPVFVATGVHPHQAGDEGPHSAQPLIENAGHDKVVAIGEAGLDYFYDKSPRAAQAQGFQFHIEAAQQTGLPLIVHTRDAEEDTMSIMRTGLEASAYKAVIHCYSSSRWLGEQAISLGFYLGVGGIVTFKNSDVLRATIADMPRDRILLETDSPYLSPVPKRGKTNEPAYVAFVAKVLAEVWQCDVAEVERVTTENFFRLFNKVPRPI